MSRRTLGRLRSLVGRLVRYRGGPSQKTTHDKDKWQRDAQKGELRFHRKDRWRPSAGFMEQTRELLAHFGFSPDDYQGKTVIDVGAGSKLRTRYFAGAKIVAIEPLAERFMEEIEWCDLADAAAVYPKPAEERVAECVDTADLVISLNVLDHCYDFDRIIENIAAYMKAGGLAFLSFDEHGATDKMHPLILSDAICRRIFAEKGLVVERYSEGAGEILSTYGHGEYCLNYWLRKAQPGGSSLGEPAG